MRDSLVLILYGLVLMLTGCQPVLSVRLASGSESLPAPGFVVEDPSQPGPEARFHTIEVYQAGGGLVWHAQARNFGSTSGGRRFAYGRAPEGFRDLVAPKPLEPGREYSVNVSGMAHGALRVRVDADGRVH